ncbi:hypothetical protein DL765_009027 [Monosporascus sp. GIB2]|nr:hypothetical protein DL765_009027 [Monosporascus sp. GIB2]
MTEPTSAQFQGPTEEQKDESEKLAKKSQMDRTIIVSLFTFISPVSSPMIAPALNAISAELSLTHETERALVLSIFILGYGRIPVLRLSNHFYLVWNTACGFSQSKSQILALRFLSGIGGSAPLAGGGGILSDCWKAEERGKAVSLYDLAPLLGPH